MSYTFTFSPSSLTYDGYSPVSTTGTLTLSTGITDRDPDDVNVKMYISKENLNTITKTDSEFAYLSTFLNYGNLQVSGDTITLDITMRSEFKVEENDSVYILVEITDKDLTTDPGTASLYRGYVPVSLTVTEFDTEVVTVTRNTRTWVPVVICIIILLFVIWIVYTVYIVFKDNDEIKTLSTEYKYSTPARRIRFVRPTECVARDV